MDLTIGLLLIALGAYLLKVSEQRKRIALLGRHLQQHQIEKLMLDLTLGYERALGETLPERQAQVWQVLTTTEAALSAQFQRFVADFALVDAAQTRVSRIAVALPFAVKLFPAATFDVRMALAIHAQGLRLAAQPSPTQSDKSRAFTYSAELFLLQHTCHWFCRSKNVASARLLGRHHSSYAQVLACVSPQTRQAYLALLAGKPH